MRTADVLGVLSVIVECEDSGIHRDLKAFEEFLDPFSARRSRGE